MVPELCEVAAAELDPETKSQMKAAAALIRDGYHLYARDDGTQAFVVRISDGFPAKLLYPGDGWCTPEDIKRKGAKVVAEDLRRQCDATKRAFH